jgi:hypothetical protein
MQLTRMPSGPWSAAIERVMLTMAPLAASWSRRRLGALAAAIRAHRLRAEPYRNPFCSPMFAGLIVGNRDRAFAGALGAPDGLAAVENRSDAECRRGRGAEGVRIGAPLRTPLGGMLQGGCRGVAAPASGSNRRIHRKAGGCCDPRGAREDSDRGIAYCLTQPPPCLCIAR